MRAQYHLKVILTLISFMLVGCAGYGPNDQMIGSTRDEIIKILGKPAGERITFDGRMMMYPRGPYGKHTYFVYIDQNERMAGWTQVLNEKNFDLIKPGMTKDEVISIVGESKVNEGIAFGRGYVWSWRYVNFHCSWFRVEFTPEDTVRYAMYQKPPECRVRR